MRIVLTIVLFFVLTLMQNIAHAASSENQSTHYYQLATHCPPSFELIELTNKPSICRLVNLYQFYDSVQNRGVGGLHTSLPKHRDNFTPKEIDLGRYLFFDPLLSKDGSLSCASCHQPDKGFSDGLDRSIGITGKKVARSAPSLWNVAFLDKLFWDGRATTLEQQAQGPLFSPVEMGNSPEHLLQSLVNNNIYKRLFAEAFPTAKKLSLAQVYRALAAFQSTLISLNSRYDRYAQGYHQALNKKEIAGLNIFRSFVARCAECHQPPLFTNSQIAVIGTPDPKGMSFDIGAQKTYQNLGVTKEKARKLRGGFKVPTLRNITKTAPYMHSGRYTKLRDAVKFYNDGRGNAVPKNEKLLLHWHIWEPDLTDDELDLIVTFLATLSDESLMPEIPKRLPSGLAVIDKNYQHTKMTKLDHNSNKYNNKNTATSKTIVLAKSGE